MKIKKIQINCQDDFKYTQIAFLVDEEGFLIDVNKARKKLGLTKVMERKEFEKELKKIQYQYLKKDQSLLNLSKNLEVKNITINVLTDYDSLTDKLLNKYGKNILYYNVIKYAIATGKVEEVDYRRPFGRSHVISSATNAQVVYPMKHLREPSEFMNHQIVLDETEIAIIINPETTQKELIEAFQLSKKFKKENKLWNVFDTKPNIREIRDWYWNHLPKDKGGEGKSYLEIAKEIKEKTESYQRREKVRKAIKSYEENLSKPLRKLEKS